MSKRKVKWPKWRPEVPRVLLIDGDIIVYQAVTELQEEYKNNKGEYTYIVSHEKVAERITERDTELKLELKAERSIWCFGSLSNFRKRVLPEYKADRSQKKPLGYYASVDWVKENFEHHSVGFLEADDVVGILHTHPTIFNKFETIAVSEDKDFVSLPGKLYNPGKPEEGILSISIFEADHAFMGQTLSGDSTDNYKGCPGVGKVGADKILKERPTLAHMWVSVVAAFTECGLTEEDALIQARVARILRFDDYDFETGNVNLWGPEYEW